MKTYLLQQEMTIRASPEEVWRFFSYPENLRKITPAYMNFKITKHPGTEELFDGMQIGYKVSPILNIPMKWVTLIGPVDRLKSFTDKQLKGPYALWEHTHTFEPVPGGTRMHDEVKYALPFGPLGMLAHALFVSRQLRSVFKYREQVLDQLFPSVEAGETGSSTL